MQTNHEHNDKCELDIEERVMIREIYQTFIGKDGKNPLTGELSMVAKTNEMWDAFKGRKGFWDTVKFIATYGGFAMTIGITWLWFTEHNPFSK